ncbi:MAG: flavoprotein subunit of a reductase [Firmicutes bacterium]|nr:flavoprotein subunit of a reductase [Bacillota bacterium]
MKNLEADIVIIGAGGAGLPAAVTAVENGAKSVIVLEKRKTVGGNAVFANGIFACESLIQRRAMIDAPKDEIYKKALAWHRYSSRLNPRILRAYINKSGDTIQWLMKRGVEFEVGAQWRLNYHQNPCWHVIKGNTPLGRFASVVKSLTSECRDKGIQILLETTGKKVVRGPQGEVTGIVAVQDGQEFEIKTKSVIITTGGFMGNKELLNKFFPFYDESFGGLVVPHDGDGIKLAAEAGGALDDVATLVRETGRTFTKDPSLGQAARQPFAIWVNKKGRRFLDEAAAEQSQICSNAVIRQPGKIAYAIYDGQMIEEIMEKGWVLPHAPIGPMPTDLKEKLEKEVASGGEVKISDNWAEIAEWIGADPNVLKNTINEYNYFCDHGYDEDFVKERRFLMPLRKGPFYVIKFGVLLIETIGPVRIDHHMEIIDKNDDPVPGLYAAGVISGGWLSDDYCGEYLFGSALSYSMNSGRIAGENASLYIKGK